MTTKKTRAIYLRRYTELPSAIDILTNKRITLLNPESWDDRNDRESMLKFAEGEGGGCVLGLCLSQAAETYHHWKIFAQSASGICIEFKKKEFLQQIPKTEFRHRKVKYKKPSEFLSGYPTSRELPFIKGWAYRHEIEYRIIYSSNENGTVAKHIPIDLGCIKSVILSPWMPSALVESTSHLLRSIPNCKEISIIHSKVVQNESWINYIHGNA